MNDDLEMGMWDREYPTEQELVDQQNSINNIADNYDDEFYEDFIEEYENEDQVFEEKSIMDKATIRLDQGRLYSMLLEHDLFDGVDALPESIANVQKEIKGFIMERLEILLGMKSEKPEIQQVIQDTPFSDLEVQVLKRVASKMSKGMTERVVNVEPKINELNTVKKQNPVSKLNTLTKSKQSTKTIKKTNNVVKTKKPIKQKKKLVRHESELVKKSDKEELGFMERFKGKSLEEANEIVAQRHRRPVPKTNINQEAINSYYTQKVAVADTKMSDYGKLMKMAALQKAQQKG
jgi:hypothetical protein